MPISPKHTHPGPLSAQNPWRWFGECRIVTLWTKSVSQPPQIWHQRRVFPIFPFFRKMEEGLHCFTRSPQSSCRLSGCCVFCSNRNLKATTTDWKPPRAAWFSYRHSLLHFHTVTSVTTLQLLQVQDLRQLRLTWKFCRKNPLTFHIYCYKPELCALVLFLLFFFFPPHRKKTSTSLKSKTQSLPNVQFEAGKRTSPHFFRANRWIWRPKCQ